MQFKDDIHEVSSDILFHNKIKHSPELSNMNYLKIEQQFQNITKLSKRIVRTERSREEV